MTPAKPPKDRVRTARTYVAAYAAEQERRPPGSLLDYQAERAAELAGRLRAAPSSIVLDDPVGTGKTVVALTAARLLLDGPVPDHWRVDRVLVVAPNQGVKDLWLERAAQAGLRTNSGDAWPRGVLLVATRRGLPKPRRRQDRGTTLVIVDEAHRGLQSAGTNDYGRLAAVTARSRVLLVTATPFQLSATGLTTMLSLPFHLHQQGLPAVDSRPIEEYATSVAVLLRAEHDAGSAAEGAAPAEHRRLTAATARAENLATKAKPALERHFVSQYERKRIGLPARSEIAGAHGVFPTPQWLRLYHVLRVLPDLAAVRTAATETASDEITYVRSSDSYQRMLLSSHGAVREHKAHERFVAWAKTEAPDLLTRVDERLRGEHPKVAATARWVADRMQEGRHVLVFCVWKRTRQDLMAALADLVGADRVPDVDDPRKAKSVMEQGFKRCPSSPDQAMAVVVQDRLSESIDLDGGDACVVHHDLPWNPVRWDQRMGRVVRASSDFRVPPEDEVFVPVLDVPADRRLYDTLVRRRDLSERVLRVASLVGEDDGPAS